MFALGVDLTSVDQDSYCHVASLGHQFSKPNDTIKFETDMFALGLSEIRVPLSL